MDTTNKELIIVITQQIESIDDSLPVSSDMAHGSSESILDAELSIQN